MARLITKFKYLKPEDRKNLGGYAEYIATREGVEKIDKSKRNAPATEKQRRLIQKILSDFPDSRSSLEYEDYLKEKTVGAASEFITRMLEENADEMMHTTTYADYIATRPRAERFGSHGLFTDDGVAVDKAMYYLHLAAEHGNQYAAQLIHSIRVNGNWTAALASLRLLGHMARVIQNRLEDERRGREDSIDRKLRRKIEEKKQAHGLKQ